MIQLNSIIYRLRYYREPGLVLSTKVLIELKYFHCWVQLHHNSNILQLNWLPLQRFRDLESFRMLSLLYVTLLEKLAFINRKLV